MNAAFILCTLIVSLLPIHSIADQWAAVKPSIAKEALEKIEAQMSYYWYCEPCGDTAPTKVHILEFSVQQAKDTRSSSVLVNGKKLDLAYVFFEKGTETLVNLAHLLNLETEGVSETVAMQLDESLHKSPWVGVFEHLDGPAKIEIKVGESGDLEISGFVSNGLSTGVVEGRLEVKRNKATHKISCDLHLELKRSKLKVVEKTPCGGIGASFDGIYSQVTPF